MNSGLIGILTIISTVITAVMICYTIIDLRKSEKKKDSLAERRENRDDYEGILDFTHEIEFEREKNTGVHLDESVYLNRANFIRLKTGFFSWVK